VATKKRGKEAEGPARWGMEGSRKEAVDKKCGLKNREGEARECLHREPRDLRKLGNHTRKKGRVPLVPEEDTTG